MATAAQRVLEIPELLEKIILELPNKDVVKLQRVKKAFKTAVERCGEIQRKLFLKRPLSNYDDSIRINPLLLPALRYYGFSGWVHVLKSSQRSWRSGYIQLQFHIDADHDCHACTTFIQKTSVTPDDIIVLKFDYISSSPWPGSFKDMLVGSSPVSFRVHVWYGGMPREETLATETISDLIVVCQRVMEGGEEYEEMKRANS